MKTINLVPSVARERATVRRRFQRWSVFLTTYAAMLAGGCAVLRLMGGEEHTRLAIDGGRLSERVVLAEKDLARVRQEVQDLARKLEASETVGVHPDWSILLASLGSLRQDGVVLQSLDIRATDVKAATGKPKADVAATAEAAKSPPPRTRMSESYAVTIKGFGLSNGEVVQFVRRLEELGPLRDVRLKEARSQAYRGVSAVAFDAEFKLVERSAAMTDTRTADAAEDKP